MRLFDPKIWKGRPLASVLAHLDNLRELPPPTFDESRIDLDSVAFDAGPLIAPGHDAVEVPTARYLAPESTAAGSAADVEIPNIELSEFIASGAFGWVFAGRLKTTGLAVAVKIIRSDYAESGGIAAREALTASSLRHRSILRVFDVTSTSLYWVIVMELVRGRNFDKCPLENATTMTQLRYLASALHYMGDNGIVHRDIKPRNIILRDHDTTPVIVDFGLAVNLATYAHDGIIAGTPMLMSPECAQGAAPSPAFDAYSLGATFCYLLWQRRWPEAAGEFSLAHAGCIQPLLQSEMNALGSSELSDIVLRLISDDPVDRLAAMQALAFEANQRTG